MIALTAAVSAPAQYMRGPDMQLCFLDSRRLEPAAKMDSLGSMDIYDTLDRLAPTTLV